MQKLEPQQAGVAAPPRGCGESPPPSMLRIQARQALAAQRVKDAAEEQSRSEVEFVRFQTLLFKKLKDVLKIDANTIEAHSEYIAIFETDSMRFVADSDQGWNTLYLLGECLLCKTEQKATVGNLAQLGELLNEFKPNYHGYNCPPKPMVAEPSLTPETELAIALRNFIQNEINTGRDV